MLLIKSLETEIGQKQILQKNLIVRILSSKRLLVDHLEIIEDELNELLENKNPTKNSITFLCTSGVLLASYVTFIHLKTGFRYLIPTISSVMPALYLKKLVKVKVHKSLDGKLAKFINSLDNFEAAIIKNKTFLQDAQIIKTSADILKHYDKDNNIPVNLVQVISDVIKVLYTFLKNLENFEIDERLSHIYEPFEDLENDDLLKIDQQNQPIDLKVIKFFFNIFAYVQSQVLWRFALIVMTNIYPAISILKNDIDGITEFIVNETKSISKFLDLVKVSKQHENNQQENLKELSLPKELREVRSGAIKSSARVLNVALQSQYLEELVLKFTGNFDNPKQKEIDEILRLMDSISNDLSLRIDEHKRIAISFQKYLNIETDDEKNAKKEVETTDSGHKSDVKIIKYAEETEVPQTDDFFFVDGTTELADEAKSIEPEDIDEVNTKLTKKYFKPVLTQLKERIEVIGEEMKEREKKVLKLKGIEIKDEPEVMKLSDDSESDSDDDRERKRKIRRNQEKFTDSRDFLGNKQQINLFGASGFPLPLKSQTLDEDVIE